MLFFYTFLAGFTAILAPCIWPLAFGFLGFVLFDRTSRVGLPVLAFIFSFGALGSLFQLFGDVGPVSFAVVQTVAGLLLFAATIVFAVSVRSSRFDLWRYPMSILIALALGAAWSPCWGSVLGSVYTIVRNGNFILPGMILLAAYGLSAVLSIVFVGTIVRDLLWRNIPPRRQIVLRTVCVVLLACSAIGLTLNLAQIVSSALLPIFPFVFFSL